MAWKRDRIIRQPRQVYHPESSEDTIATLADAIGLDVDTADKWAVKDSGSVSVPNVWLCADLLQGGGILDRLINIGGSLGTFFSTLLTPHTLKKVKVVRALDLNTRILRYCSSGDLWGLSIFAHGSKSGSVDSSDGDDTSLPYIFSCLDRLGYRVAMAHAFQCYSKFSGYSAKWEARAVRSWGYHGIDALGLDLHGTVLPHDEEEQ